MRETYPTKENQVLDVALASHSCWPAGLHDLWRSLQTQTTSILWLFDSLEISIPEDSQSLNTQTYSNADCCLFLRMLDNILEVSLQGTTFYHHRMTMVPVLGGVFSSSGTAEIGQGGMGLKLSRGDLG